MNKYLKYYLAFLVLLENLNYTECAKCSCRKKIKNYTVHEGLPKRRVEPEKNDCCRLRDAVETDNHLPMQNCCYGASMKGRIINSFETYKNHPQDIFKSACMKCTLCLAIAQSMNETFRDENLYNQCPMSGKSCLCKILEPLCTDGFKNYDLRETDEGDILLTVSSPKSKHVPTSFDGSWTEKLRQTCRKYLDNMDCDLLEKLKSGSTNFVDYLCNGDGLFRDCRNINLKRVDFPERESNFCAKCNYPGNQTR